MDDRKDIERIVKRTKEKGRDKIRTRVHGERKWCESNPDFRPEALNNDKNRLDTGALMTF